MLIEYLIDWTNAWDGDPELEDDGAAEPDADGEDGGGREPSLGWPEFSPALAALIAPGQAIDIED